MIKLLCSLYIYSINICCIQIFVYIFVCTCRHTYFVYILCGPFIYWNLHQKIHSRRINESSSKQKLFGRYMYSKTTNTFDFRNWTVTESHVVVRPNIPAIKVIHKVNATTENSVSLPFSTGKMLACY